MRNPIPLRNILENLNILKVYLNFYIFNLNFKVVHSCSQDFIFMRTNFGISMTNLYDTQLLADIMNLKPSNFQDLIQDLFLYRVMKFNWKEHKWDNPPYSPLQIKYARTDVRLLDLLYKHLQMKATSIQVEEMKETLQRNMSNWAIKYSCRRL
jgi:ribonuclease D